MPIKHDLFYQRLALVTVTMLVAGLFLGASSPQAANMFVVPYDKLVHAITYSFITFLLWLSFNRNPVLSSVVMAGLVGIADEFYQLFLPGREADLIDLMTDFVAIGATSSVLRLMNQSSE